MYGPSGCAPSAIQDGTLFAGRGGGAGASKGMAKASAAGKCLHGSEVHKAVKGSNTLAQVLPRRAKHSAPTNSKFRKRSEAAMVVKTTGAPTNPLL